MNMIEILGWERLFYHAFGAVAGSMAVMGWFLYFGAKRKLRLIQPKITKKKKHTDIVSKPNKNQNG